MSNINGTIVGIDLGTSTSEIAVIQDGKPVVIPNKNGSFITPSVVYIGKAPENGEPEIIVGEFAQEYLLTRPERTFAEVKRNTGSDFIYEVDGIKYKPEDIQAMLIKYLIECAEIYLGEKITRAVITVPAYFNNIQRQCTERAGTLAGITIERIINEPTAAAMDFGLSHMADESKILVFDLGGGTLDVTLLELFQGVVDVKATSGNNALGGKDFDEMLSRYIYDNKEIDIKSAARLKAESVKCKTVLSKTQEYNVLLPFFTTAAGESITLEKNVTRSAFENITRSLLVKMREPVKTALSEAHIEAENLDKLLLVGGATRMPCVAALVRDLLKKEPEQSVDPDLTVVRGAAIQAGIISGVFNSDEEIALTDVCAFSLRVSNAIDGIYDMRRTCIEMIKRNTTIPAENSFIAHPMIDYQKTVVVKAYQGEYRDPGNNSYLGEVTVNNLPPKRRENNPIKITMKYDLNGMLNVRAEVLSTGKAAETDIDMSNAVTRDSSTLSLDSWKDCPLGKTYRPLIRRAERLIKELEESENIVRGLHDDDYVISEELEFLIDALKEAIILDNPKRADELKEDVMEILEDE
jgi:molecular chaperone DnaK